MRVKLIALRSALVILALFTLLGTVLLFVLSAALFVVVGRAGDA